MAQHLIDDEDVLMLLAGECTPQELLSDVREYGDGAECEAYVSEAMAYVSSLVLVDGMFESRGGAFVQSTDSRDAY